MIMRSKIIDSGIDIGKELHQLLLEEDDRVVIENNLPVVAGSWVEALLSSGELPEFENHLVKERK